MICHSSWHSSSLLAPFHLATNITIGWADHSPLDPPLLHPRCVFCLCYSFLDGSELTEAAEHGRNRIALSTRCSRAAGGEPIKPKWWSGITPLMLHGNIVIWYARHPTSSFKEHMLLLVRPVSRTAYRGSTSVEPHLSLSTQYGIFMFIRKEARRQIVIIRSYTVYYTYPATYLNI